LESVAAVGEAGNCADAVIKLVASRQIKGNTFFIFYVYVKKMCFRIPV
jgi:hypothetical protein